MYMRQLDALISLLVSTCAIIRGKHRRGGRESLDLALHPTL